MFIYNQAGRVRGAYLGNNQPLAWYTYDVWGRRIVQYGSGAKHFHYDLSGNLIAETTGDENLIKAYIRLNGQPIAQITANGSVYYYHTDHLGTPQKMTDQSGAIVWAADYLSDVTLETVENNLQFPGQYYDAETGLHYNWHRYYDPETGRYLTADPIGLDGGINLYAYAGNDPVNFVDPKGTFSYQAVFISYIELMYQKLQKNKDYYGDYFSHCFLSCRGHSVEPPFLLISPTDAYGTSVEGWQVLRDWSFGAGSCSFDESKKKNWDRDMPSNMAGAECADNDCESCFECCRKFADKRTGKKKP